MTRYIKTACLVVVVAFALVSAVFFSYKCIRQATADAAPEETTEMTEATETVPPETEPTTVPTEETIPEETTATEETVPVETEAPKVTIDAVPHYHQSEYPDIRYGNGTIATSGSSIAALAMVATYMTDHVYTPADIADYAVQYGGSHYKRLEKVSDLMQIPWKRALNVNEALKAVREGKIAIALMGSRSVFPGGNHFIVLTGVTEDGKIWVLDPDDRDYGAWGVGELLENGFPDGKLIAGYEGAWIYDKTQMPEEPFIYEPEPAPEESRYPGLELTDAEIKLMADLIFMEAQSEPFEGQQAVAEVIFNRLKSGNFQSSINSIIYAKDQFAAVKNLYLAKPTDTQYKAIERALNGPYVLPEDVVFYAKFAVNKKIWGTIGSHIFCYSY
ncbi:MAG: cell wall hydrolase [Oscillospiraceae bacterium]|nr:cell wall hydrolase [Oscillospiraceae bacterium]